MLREVSPNMMFSSLPLLIFTIRCQVRNGEEYRFVVVLLPIYVR